MKERVELKNGWELKRAGEDSWRPVRKFPAQVQDVLFEEGVLTEEFRLGWCSEALFIGESDWIYRTFFDGKAGKSCRLLLEGIDTVADVILNGKWLGRCQDFYLSYQYDISGLLVEKNCLEICFKSPLKHLQKLMEEKSVEEGVMKCKLMRKPIHDFPPEGESQGSNYQGAVPSFTPVGIYAPVYLEYFEEEEILESYVQAILQERKQGALKVQASGKGHPERVQVSYTLHGVEYIKEIPVPPAEDGWEICREILVEDPPLWFPRGMGEQNLLEIEVSLWNKGEKKDRVKTQVGFRKVEMKSPLDFVINGKKVRLFGGSLDPMQGYTHCYQKERAKRLFLLVENANMNTLRIWGEGIPLPQDFYKECDRRGILVWQEFFLGNGAYPEYEEIQQACIREAEVLVKRLREHPCILLWCGGNETIMGAQFQGRKDYDYPVLSQGFPKLLQKLDPQRYYHSNSPSLGEWANDPREGDFHTYDCVWEYPYKDYPNFISEHIRVAPPVKHSLEKMIHGPLWDSELLSRDRYWEKDIFPVNWLERSHEGAMPQRKTAAYWEFYEAETAEDLLYNMGAAYAREIRRYGEQVRVGNRDPRVIRERSKGYFACKLADTWPKIYCAPIDFFQEVYIPYYGMKRMMAPELLCFQREETIRLWYINDTGEDREGTVEYGLFDLTTETYIRKEQKYVRVKQGGARLVKDFGEFAFFSKDCILFASFVSEEKSQETVCIDYADIERHLRFPEPELEIAAEGDILWISARHFARCVEITGEDQGDPFGWLFEDNYFDMLPGQKRGIRILGEKSEGTLTVKSHYGKKKEIFWKRSRKK